MTTQRRMLIEPHDITGLEYECVHCHSRWFVSIERFDRRVAVCPNCNEHWLEGNTGGSGEGFSDDQLIAEFVGLLKSIQGRKFGAVIRLELREPALRDE
jgi:DNA-directed RNA polymerase subunit RPC12/RpoP